MHAMRIVGRGAFKNFCLVMLKLLPSNNTYGFSQHTKFFIIPQKALFLVSGLLGFHIIHLPSYYFYKCETNIISFLFLRKYHFVSFLRHLSYLLNRLSQLYFVRLTLRGLGYKVRRFGFSLVRFYFTMEMFTYFHVPRNLLFRSRKNRMLLISSDLSLLGSVVAHILLLRKVQGYTKRGFWSPKTLVFLRKRRKV